MCIYVFTWLVYDVCACMCNMCVVNVHVCHMCICMMYMHMCVHGICVVNVHVCLSLCRSVEARGGCLGSWFVIFFIPLRWDLSLNLELGWQPESTNDPLVSVCAWGQAHLFKWLLWF